MPLTKQRRCPMAMALAGAGAWMMVAGGTAFASPPLSPPPVVRAEAAVVMDVATGRILYEKNANRALPPASTLKILTALLALERAPVDAVVPISDRAQNTEGSSMYLRAGSRWPLQQLLDGLLLASGNDAAVAIAEYIGGSVDGFAEMMNQKAKEIGADKSRFVNPSGLPAPGQVTTARDLALIARAALHNPTFRDIVARREVSLTAPGGTRRVIYNNNRLLGLEGIDGVKTGYTAEAGHTYVASATRRGWQLVVTLMRDDKQGKWDDARTLLDWAYSSYHPVPLLNAAPSIRVPMGNRKEITLYLPAAISHTGLRIPLRKDGSESVYYEIFMPENLDTVVPAGQAIGRLVVYLNSQPSWRLPLVAKEDFRPVQGVSLWDSILRTLKTIRRVWQNGHAAVP